MGGRPANSGSPTRPPCPASHVWQASCLTAGMMDAVRSSSTSADQPSPTAATHSIQRALLVVNPGARRARRAEASARGALAASGVECVVVETEAPGHATELVAGLLAAGDRYDAVIALGGDGTVMEVCSALAGVEDAPPVGIIACGTANVLARSLTVPLHVGRAVRALLDADVGIIDLGRLGDGRRFAIGLGVGLDASMIGGASSLMKRRLGWLAYAWSAVRAGLRLERFTVRLTVDGTVHELETSSLLVANFGAVLGGIVCFGQGIAHHDGELDACVYSPRHLVDAARIFLGMVTGRVHRDRRYRVIRGRHFVIETEPPRPAQADGELIGLTPLEIRIEPRALRVLMPRTRRARWRFA